MSTAEIEILADAHMDEQFARLGTMHHAAARDRSRRLAAQIALAETDRAAIGYEPRNRIEERGLAGAIEADDRDKFVLSHPQIHAI